MKWKIGAVLMFVVFCLAILPTAISGVKAGGLDKIFNNSTQLVIQKDNNYAMFSGEKVSFGENILNAVTTDENDDFLLPVAGTASVMGMKLDWDGASNEATLNKDDDSIQVSVIYPQTTDINAPVFMSAKQLADSMGWTYTVSKNGYFAVLSDKETDDKTMSKLCDKATELIGVPKDMLLKSSFIFRAGSDSVIKSGDKAYLEDSDGFSYSPIIEDKTYYLPVASLSSFLGGTTEIDDDKNITVKLDETELNITKDSISVNGKVNKDIPVLYKNDILYVSAKGIASIMNYKHTGSGDIFIMGKLPYGNADTQVAELTELGNQLTDQGAPIPKADAYVALTFDDGPTGGSEGLTVRLLNGLKERNAHATFFMCGYRIKDFHTHMDRYLAEGHEIGNHTMDHPDGFYKKPYETIFNQIKSNSDLIESYCGQGPSVFRPVGGGVNDNVKKAAETCGLPIINWSVDTEDWKYRDAERIKNVIVQNAKDGDIVLMHDLRECTLEGALNAIDILSKNGYAFVTVEQLARIKGVELKPGHVYTDFRDSTVKKLKAEA